MPPRSVPARRAWNGCWIKIRHADPGCRPAHLFYRWVFPGETDAAFSARLVEFVRGQRFDRVGVFTYSREENTAAYSLPDQGCGAG